MGNTQWRLAEGHGKVDMSRLESGGWCPVSWVKKARQSAVEDLMMSGSKTKSWHLKRFEKKEKKVSWLMNNKVF